MDEPHFTLVDQTWAVRLLALTEYFERFRRPLFGENGRSPFELAQLIVPNSRNVYEDPPEGLLYLACRPGSVERVEVLHPDLNRSIAANIRDVLTRYAENMLSHERYLIQTWEETQKAFKAFRAEGWIDESFEINLLTLISRPLVARLEGLDDGTNHLFNAYKTAEMFRIALYRRIWQLQWQAYRNDKSCPNPSFRLLPAPSPTNVWGATGPGAWNDVSLQPLLVGIDQATAPLVDRSFSELDSRLPRNILSNIGNFVCAQVYFLGLCRGVISRQLGCGDGGGGLSGTAVRGSGVDISSALWNAFHQYLLKN